MVYSFSEKGATLVLPLSRNDERGACLFHAGAFCNVKVEISPIYFWAPLTAPGRGEREREDPAESTYPGTIIMHQIVLIEVSIF